MSLIFCSEILTHPVTQAVTFLPLMPKICLLDICSTNFINYRPDFTHAEGDVNQSLYGCKIIDLLILICCEAKLFFSQFLNVYHGNDKVHCIMYCPRDK